MTPNISNKYARFPSQKRKAP
ncbi:unnamed protein product [Debaryomyces tyrocola]|nr:unnamed protein product [Debaryomyces tyrocola]